MEMLQENFSLLTARFGDYRRWLASDASERIAAREGRDAEWRENAERATAAHRTRPCAPVFDAGERPEPEPAMRIGPRV